MGQLPPPRNKPKKQEKVMSHDMLKFFEYSHLPPFMRDISKPFGDLAQHLDATLPDGAEKTMALRKLMEGKDCAVRSVL